MRDEVFTCEICGRAYSSGQRQIFGDQELCPDCFQQETLLCSVCGARIWADENAAAMALRSASGVTSGNTPTVSVAELYSTMTAPITPETMRMTRSPCAMTAMPETSGRVPYKTTPTNRSQFFTGTGAGIWVWSWRSTEPENPLKTPKRFCPWRMPGKS